MDPSSQALRRVRDDVIQSRTWSKLQKELMMHMRQMEYRAEEGQLRTFNSLSTREKIATVERAVKEVGKTPTYTKLQSQVVSAIDRHFSPLIYTQVTQQDIATSSSSIHLSPLAHPLAEACSRLLQASPHLKHSLKYALNHPLPPKLRFTAWKILLEYPSVQKDFMLTGKEMRPRSETEREIPQRCETIVNDNPVFRYIAESQTSLLALQAVMLYWKQRTSGTVLDSEILLCIPFIHVWNEELKRHVGEGKGEGWLLFAEIAGEYVHFMEMLPPSIGNAAEDGMNKFTQCVMELLETQYSQLYKKLQKLFKKASSGMSRSSQREANAFQPALKSILYPHIQQMLVGDVSMDVLCYIWDQCFVGLDVPEYQCLPYFTTVWLILLRDRFLKATTIEAVEETLSVHSHSLTTIQFQKEIENRFLHHLSSLLKIKPLPVNSTQSHPLLPPPTLPSHLPLTHSDSHHPMTLPSSNHPLHTVRRGRGTSAQYGSSSVGYTGMDIQQRMEEIEKRVDRVLSHRIREEREQQRQQFDVFRRELGELKMGLPKRRSSVGQLAHLQSPPIQTSTSKQPTLLLVDASGSKSSRTHGMRVIPVNISSQQTLSDNRRPFSPSSLSEDDVKTLWLIILKKFTTAAYTICHGTGSERQTLFSTLYPTNSDTEP